MRLFEMIYEKDDERQGTFGWSFVAVPATETEAVFLSKETEAVELAMADEEQIMYAVGLVPNQKIMRSKKGSTPYDIVFPLETIKLASQSFINRAGESKFNLEHSIPVEGAKVVESWLVKDSEMDKAKSVGLTAPNGSWVLGFHVEDKKDWTALKDSGITGISMEGIFAKQEIEALELAAEDNIIDILVAVAESYT